MISDCNLLKLCAAMTAQCGLVYQQPFEDLLKNNIELSVLVSTTVAAKQCFDVNLYVFCFLDFKAAPIAVSSSCFNITLSYTFIYRSFPENPDLLTTLGLLYLQVSFECLYCIKIDLTLFLVHLI